MANLPFQRTIINPRERPLSSDINRGFSEAYATQQELEYRRYQLRTGGSVLPDIANPVVNGFVGSGFKIYPNGGANMQVVVAPGVGYQDDPVPTGLDLGGIVGLNDNHRMKVLSLTVGQVFNVPAAAGSTRIDIIQVKYQELLEDVQSRDILDPTSGIFAAGNVFKTLSPNINGHTGSTTPAAGGVTLNYKIGTPGSGAPSPDVGWILLGQVVVPTGTTVIDTDKVIDNRKVLGPNGRISIGGFVKITGDGTAGAFNDFNGPPGVVGGIMCNGSLVDSGYYAVLVFSTSFVGGGVYVKSITPFVTGTSVTFSAGGPALSYPRCKSVGTELLSSADQANLQSASYTSTPVKMAVNQPVAKAVITCPWFQTGESSIYAYVELMLSPGNG